MRASHWNQMQSVAAVRRLLWLARLAAEEEDAVVTTKTMDPPTGDKRTYMSLATYCWPSNPEDLANPKGPWTCTDGKAFLGVSSCVHAVVCFILSCCRLFHPSCCSLFHMCSAPEFCLGFNSSLPCTDALELANAADHAHLFGYVHVPVGHSKQIPDSGTMQQNRPTEIVIFLILAFRCKYWLLILSISSTIHPPGSGARLILSALTETCLCMQRHVIAPDFMMLVQLFNRVYKISMAYYFTGNCPVPL